MTLYWCCASSHVANNTGKTVRKPHTADMAVHKSRLSERRQLQRTIGRISLAHGCREYLRPARRFHVGVRDLEYTEIIAPTANDLETYGKPSLIEASRYSGRRQAA